MRIAPNDVGTYTIDAQIGAVAADGIAKLESAPNLGCFGLRTAQSMPPWRYSTWPTVAASGVFCTSGNAP